MIRLRFACESCVRLVIAASAAARTRGVARGSSRYAVGSRARRRRRGGGSRSPHVRTYARVCTRARRGEVATFLSER